MAAMAAERQPLATVKPLAIRPFQATEQSSASSIVEGLSDRIAPTPPTEESLRIEQHVAASQYASLVVPTPQPVLQLDTRDLPCAAVPAKGGLADGLLRQLAIRDDPSHRPSLDALVATSLEDTLWDGQHSDETSPDSAPSSDEVYPTAFASTSPPPSSTMKSSMQRSSIDPDSWRSLLPPHDPYSLNKTPSATSIPPSLPAQSISPTPSLVSHASSSVASFATSARAATPTSNSSFSLPDSESWRTLLPETDPAALVSSDGGSSKGWSSPKPWGPVDPTYQGKKRSSLPMSRGSSMSTSSSSSLRHLEQDAYGGFTEGSSRAAFNPIYFSDRVRSLSAREAEAGYMKPRKDRHYSFNGSSTPALLALRNPSYVGLPPLIARTAMSDQGTAYPPPLTQQQSKGPPQTSVQVPVSPAKAMSGRSGPTSVILSPALSCSPQSLFVALDARSPVASSSIHADGEQSHPNTARADASLPSTGVHPTSTLETLPSHYSYAIPLLGYSLKDITLATMDLTLLIIAQTTGTSTDVGTSEAGRLEHRLVLGSDANMGSVRAEFDGIVLKVTIDRVAAADPMTAAAVPSSDRAA